MTDVTQILSQIEQGDPQAAELVKLWFFAGLSLGQAAEVVGLPRSTAYEHWAYARARLRCLIGQEE